MPPKGKEKPKTKKEIKAEQEAAARAAEEERLRQEEAARCLAEQIEQRRQELLTEYTSQTNARLSVERQELVPLLLRMQQERASMAASRASLAEWDQYLSCNPLPDPRDTAAMNDFLNSMRDADSDLHKTLMHCQACIQLAEQCLNLAAEGRMEASLQEALDTFVMGLAAGSPATSDDTCSGGSELHAEQCPEHLDERTAALATESDTAANQQAASTTTAQAASPWDAAASAAACHALRERAAQHEQNALALHNNIKALVDTATAGVLLHADEYADPKGDVVVTAQQGQLQWGLWVNTQRNPRFKSIEFAGLGMSVEIPKQLALANVAIRVQRQMSHALDTSSTQPAAEGSCLAPLGGVLQAELLALPPPPRSGRGWTIRQVSPQSGSIATVPYPIPPVGADPSVWRPDEEPPPVHFSLKLPERLLVPAAVHVGWWDKTQQAWSMEGVSNVSYDATTQNLSFSSTHLGCLALLQDTSAHLPYSAWTIRPTGGLGGCTAVVELQVAGLPGSDSNSSGSDSPTTTGGKLSFEVGSGWVKLCGPSLPQLAHLLGRAQPLWELLIACQACGLRLTPSSFEAAALGLPGKVPAAEQAMCADLAMLCTKFLVASSRWNQVVGQDMLLVRLSEVTDWEEGGRTSSQATARIFNKESSEGPRRVLVARREGARGVAWTAGGDTCSTPPQAQDLSTVEAVQAAMQDADNCIHASLLHLLAKQQGGGADLCKSLDVDAGFVGCMVQLLLALHTFVFG